MKACKIFTGRQPRRGSGHRVRVFLITGALFISLFISCSPCLNTRVIYVYKTINVYDTVQISVYDTLIQYETINVYDTVIYNIYDTTDVINYETINVYDTVIYNIYDTTDVINIADCDNYEINVSNLDSSSKAEMNKVFNEFIRKLNNIHFK